MLSTVPNPDVHAWGSGNLEGLSESMDGSAPPQPGLGVGAILAAEKIGGKGKTE